MVRKIIISFLVVLFIFSCAGYRKNEKISLKNIPFDYKAEDTVFTIRNKEIELYKKDSNYIIEYKNIKYNAFSYLNAYSLYNKKLVGNEIRFYTIPIGKWKRYDENGKLKEERNYDEPYKFSVNQLIKKMKKEYHINLAIDDKDRDIDVYRGILRKIKPCYVV